MLIHPDYEGRVTQDWFNAATWGDQARPVSSGGRGGAWFLQAGEDKLVLREYRRGGLVAKFARYAYAFTREADVRSFAEFRLLNAMLSKGLPYLVRWQPGIGNCHRFNTGPPSSLSDWRTLHH
nr:lipopolysaccharide kinase InaA family protein [Marinobacter salsuginis]